LFGWLGIRQQFYRLGLISYRNSDLFKLLLWFWEVKLSFVNP
jgi:hypothetical protein